MLDIIGHMTPGKDGSHHYNEALLFQQLRRRTGRPWLVVEVLKRRRQMVGIQRAYVAGLRDQIALEEGAVFPVHPHSCSMKTGWPSTAQLQTEGSRRSAHTSGDPLRCLRDIKYRLSEGGAERCRFT
jgi:hypothetical protein